jgi:hypothetical protein
VTPARKTTPGNRERARGADIRSGNQFLPHWYSIHSLIRTALKLGGIYWRGQRNAERVRVRHNKIRCQRLSRALDGFTLLHISDLHADMNQGAMKRLEELLPHLNYDICVITGDYRGAPFGPFADALKGALIAFQRSHFIISYALESMRGDTFQASVFTSCRSHWPLLARKSEYAAARLPVTASPLLLID